MRLPLRGACCVPLASNVMQLETQPFDTPTTVEHGSDVAEVHFAAGRLEVLVASSSAGEGRFNGLRITFPEACGFRMLDEADFARYWAYPGFRHGHHVLSVVGGGWRSEESTLQGLPRNEGNEWLIVTGNRCVSVLSSEAPQVVGGEFDDAA
ncbi:hypothetical protein MCEMSHM24_03762 [Comamonadaceae bacterium]